MPNILAYAWDHCGLGHVARLVAVLQGLRDLDSSCRGFILAEQDSPLLRESRIPYVVAPTFGYGYRGRPQDRPPSRDQRWKEAIFRSMAETAVRETAPAAVLHDSVISSAVYDEALAHGIPQALILRHRLDLGEYLGRLEEELKELSLVVFPHLPGELPGVVEQIGSRCGTVFTGPILRAAQDADPEALRRRYGIEAGATTVLVTGGGGGSFDQDAYLAAVVRVLESRISAPTTVVVCTGYFYEGVTHLPARNPNITWRITRHEEALSSLMELADLVVCQTGANTILEAIDTGVQILTVPAPRKYDDQAARARAVASREDLVTVVPSWEPEVMGPLVGAALSAPRRGPRPGAGTAAAGRDAAARAVLALIR